MQLETSCPGRQCVYKCIVKFDLEFGLMSMAHGGKRSTAGIKYVTYVLQPYTYITQI